MLAKEANQLLEAYQNWLLEHQILDHVLQQETFKTLLENEPVQTWFWRWKHWLIDDIDEYSFFEQQLLEQMVGENGTCYYSANPRGGIMRHLGAYPGYIQTLESNPQVKVQTLQGHQPFYHLGRKITAIMAEENLPVESARLVFPVETSPDMTEMLENMVNQIKSLLQQGVAPRNILLTTWLLNEQMALQLSAMLDKINCPLHVFRGSLVIQRNPLVNTLLSLIRLVCWNHLKADPMIPKLSGYEMSQILMFCGQLDAFEAARLRDQYGDKLSEWGKYLKAEGRTEAVKVLQEKVESMRENLFTPVNPTLYTLALEIWENLLLPSPLFQENLDSTAIGSFFHILSQYTLLDPQLPELDLAWKFIYQMLNEEILEFPDMQEALAANSVKLMTLHRLCEMGLETDYQLWFDLKSPFWQRSDFHIIDNRLMISREWSVDQPWSLDLNEQRMDQKLARMFHKGIQYCQKQAYFFACQYNLVGQRQRFERLVMSLEKPINLEKQGS